MPALTSPSRITFWRILLTVFAFLGLFSMFDWLSLADELGIKIVASKTLTFWFIGLTLLTALSALGMLLTVATFRRIWLNRLFSPGEVSRVAGFIQTNWFDAPLKWRWMAVLYLLGALIIFPALILYPPIERLIGDKMFLRVLITMLAGLVGGRGLISLAKSLQYPVAFAAAVMLVAFVFRVAAGVTAITDYPFSMGWSETSRFYWPSLFLSASIYGQAVPWPILHPTLHLALIPPYLVDAPLWLHRFWQEFLRIGMLAALAPFIINRAKISHKWLAALWMTLFLLQGPVYYHLTIPVMLVLWGYSEDHPRRTWIVLMLASAYCGWSRVNWWPMPGLLMAVLYLLEVPVNRSPGKYLLKPASFFVVGIVTAFLAQRAYIALSGIPNPADFYTSFTSALLWYRLMPNASFSLGVLPGLILISAPLWILFYTQIDTLGLGKLRLSLILAALAVLLFGGIVVSMKIGGGADLHNIDAYLVMLLIVGAYVWGRATQSGGKISSPGRFNDAKVSTRVGWLLIAILVAIPAWFNIRGSYSFKVYNPAQASVTLNAIQTSVHRAQNNGGEVLFINQRHLISMKILPDLKLTVPEYEREELMEMAMAQNSAYLDHFEQELRGHRFALIVVDPLRTDKVGSNYAMAEEQNVWNRFVSKPILRFYCPVFISDADRVAIYAPRVDGAACLP
jgi:hypothetical protein